MGLFGNDSKKTFTTVTNQDQRIQVGGSTGTLIGPGASVNVKVTNTGMESADLKTLLDEVLGQQGASNQQLADIVAATKAPNQTALSSLLPWLALGLALLMVGRRYV